MDPRRCTPPSCCLCKTVIRNRATQNPTGPLRNHPWPSGLPRTPATHWLEFPRWNPTGSWWLQVEHGHYLVYEEKKVNMKWCHYKNSKIFLVASKSTKQFKSKCWRHLGKSAQHQAVEIIYIYTYTFICHNGSLIFTGPREGARFDPPFSKMATV